jgi:exosortase
MIMIGPYQLMVQDACAGLNSIFALSAIGILYVYMAGHSLVRNIILLCAAVPIAIVANVIRVAALVLIAYYGGIAAVEGPFHEGTGIALFAVALLLFLLLDGLIGSVIALSRIARHVSTKTQSNSPAR